MKKIVKSILIFVLLSALAAACGCKKIPVTGPTEITIPTPEPTEQPVEIDPAVIDGYLGDWYGVYYVTAAGGMYADNRNVRNDCALRVSIDSFGEGRCYLAVNGMEKDNVSASANVFALCSAEIEDGLLAVKGMINRSSVEWHFEKSGSVLRLAESYGTAPDYMDIEIMLARPDALGISGLRYDAGDYIAENGFCGIVDKLGGSTAELPELVPPEGRDAHDFFTNETSSEVRPVEEDDGRLKGRNGVSLSMPDGWVVLENDVLGLTVAGPAENVWMADFSISTWDTDALSFLFANVPNASEICHYAIDGFDCYATFVPNTSGSSETTVFKLCGSNGAGKLIVINLTLGMDKGEAYSFVNLENESFTQLVLGAKFGL